MPGNRLEGGEQGEEVRQAEWMMNGAALGQTATSSYLDIFIFLTAACDCVCVRRYLWAFNRAPFFWR